VKKPNYVATANAAAVVDIFSYSPVYRSSWSSRLRNVITPPASQSCQQQTHGQTDRQTDRQRTIPIHTDAVVCVAVKLKAVKT